MSCTPPAFDLYHLGGHNDHLWDLDDEDDDVDVYDVDVNENGDGECDDYEEVDVRLELTVFYPSIGERIVSVYCLRHLHFSGLS